jgi:hypothetical protein
MKRRGRPSKDPVIVKHIYYSGGVVDVGFIERFCKVGPRRAKQIFNKLLCERVSLENGRRLFLFKEEGLRGDKIRIVTHASSTDILLVTGFILINVSTPFLEFLRLSLLDGLYSLERLGMLLFNSSIMIIALGLAILACSTYTTYLSGLGKKLHLRIKFRYKHKSYPPEYIRVKENTMVWQLIELTLKKFLKKDRLIVENYVAILDRDNKLLVLDSSKRLYEYGIRDKDNIIVESVKRQNGLSGTGYTLTDRPVRGWRFTDSLKTFIHQSPREVLGWARNLAEKFSKYFRTWTRQLKAWVISLYKLGHIIRETIRGQR